MHYALLLNNAEPEDGEVSDDVMHQMQEAMAAYTDALHAAGVFISADIMDPPRETTTVTRRDGELTVQDGPFAETRESLAGVFLIDVPDKDAALAWAEKCPATQYAVIEVRRAAASCADGVWAS
ncbi:MAG TPA: YciI family protein [Jiangellaceae bacterium]|nr:YciI family protein [Jiangellaceae bacterium]